MTSYNKNYETPANREMSNRAFDIEKKSLDIIDSEIGQHDYNELEWAVVRRVIHATADFDFARRERVVFHRNAITSAFNAIKNKCNIVTDVDMVLSAINKKLVTDLGLKVMCYISDKSLANEARKFNKTRSEMAMRRAANEMNGGIVAIGNAPTALYETINMIREDVAKPALVIGIPVGFVSATESKDELMKINIPF
ncbi:MAG TPA: precorrin-8X methylmutase, partial [Nitrososphaeraceae archaeon]|nr:precorrin-8X methylmutase [Nitrososphaeraceae archaeon]